MKAQKCVTINLAVILLLLSSTCFAETMLNGDRIGVPSTFELNLGFPSDSSTLQMEPIDLEAVYEEETLLRNSGRPPRIGINRQIYQPDLTDGETVQISSSQTVWRFQIHSPGALKMRVHFSEFQLSPEDQVFVFNPDNGEAPSYSYTGTGVSHEGNFWTWATAGERVVIEWNTTTNQISNLPFAIDQISHAYRDPIGEFMKDQSRVGNCHNDATCDTDYRQLRDASAYIEFQDGDWYICSGTMLSDTSHDFRPFFLTANHCISTQPVATSIQVFFYYHTATCNVGHASVGATRNGSTLRATRTDSDFCLLELTSTNFTSVYFAGWDTSTVATGEALTSVHHPDGSYKRISYGSRTSSSSTNMWEVIWNRTARPGVTEGGSSGCGLFRDSTHHLIGQLYGGGSSCQQQNSPDVYGKFTRSYSNGNLSTWLGSATTCDGQYYSGSATPTPPVTQTPAATATPAASRTPTPPPTHAQSPTATPACSTTGCQINMPSDYFTVGDSCYCTVTVCNKTGSPMMDTPIFVILAILDQFYFAPSFSGFDLFTEDLPVGSRTLNILNPFEWPSNTGSFDGAIFYAAMTNTAMTQIIGSYDAFSFGWGS